MQVCQTKGIKWRRPHFLFFFVICCNVNIKLQLDELTNDDGDSGDIYGAHHHKCIKCGIYSWIKYLLHYHAKRFYLKCCYFLFNLFSAEIIWLTFAYTFEVVMFVLNWVQFLRKMLWVIKKSDVMILTQSQQRIPCWAMCRCYTN